MNLQRFTPVKVIDVAFRDDSDYATRFQREAQAIAQLNHPRAKFANGNGRFTSTLTQPIIPPTPEPLQLWMPAVYKDAPNR